MSKCVIKVGVLYYAGTETDGRELFTYKANEAVQFDMEFKGATANAIANDLGGTLVPVPAPYVPKNSRRRREPFPGLNGTKGEIEEWLRENASYILNCTGPELEMIQWYMAWSNRAERRYDMSRYMKGVPCELQVIAVEDRDHTSVPAKFTFAFVLRVTEQLSTEQQKLWDNSQYGVLLVDGRRLLSSSMDALMSAACEVPEPRRRNALCIPDTAERRAAIEKYQASLKVQEAKEPSKSPQGGVKKMSLQ